MKEITHKIAIERNSSLSTVEVDAETKYYGVATNQSGRGFITRRQYDQGPFFILVPFAMTNGNGVANIGDSYNLSTFINDLTNKGYKVYEFDIAKNLFKWLAE